MKCVQTVPPVKIIRVTNEVAQRLVNSGQAHYIPKSKWKALRTPEQLAEIKKMQQQQMPTAKYFGSKDKARVDAVLNTIEQAKEDE